jgi:hypothetical protein
LPDRPGSALRGNIGNLLIEAVAVISINKMVDANRRPGMENII